MLVFWVIDWTMFFLSFLLFYVYLLTLILRSIFWPRLVCTYILYSIFVTSNSYDLVNFNSHCILTGHTVPLQYCFCVYFHYCRGLGNIIYSTRLLIKCCQIFYCYFFFMRNLCSLLFISRRMDYHFHHSQPFVVLEYLQEAVLQGVAEKTRASLIKSLEAQWGAGVTQIQLVWRACDEAHRVSAVYHQPVVSSLQFRRSSAIVDSLSEWPWEIHVSFLSMSCDLSCGLSYGPYTANQNPFHCIWIICVPVRQHIQPMGIHFTASGSDICAPTSQTSHPQKWYLHQTMFFIILLKLSCVIFYKCKVRYTWKHKIFIDFWIQILHAFDLCIIIEMLNLCVKNSRAVFLMAWM